MAILRPSVLPASGALGLRQVVPQRLGTLAVSFRENAAEAAASFPAGTSDPCFGQVAAAAAAGAAGGGGWWPGSPDEEMRQGLQKRCENAKML